MSEPYIMTYFAKSEFQGHYRRLHPSLPPMLDKLREKCGHPILISQAEGAVGRTTGKGYHNYVLHGSVMAVDLMPYKEDVNGVPQPLKAWELGLFLDAAEGLGFGGIGIYPKWRPYPGVHLDIGPANRRWSGLGGDSSQEYVSLREGIKLWKQIHG